MSQTSQPYIDRQRHAISLVSEPSASSSRPAQPAKQYPLHTVTLFGTLIFLAMLLSGCIGQSPTPDEDAFRFQFLNGVSLPQMPTINDGENRLLIIDVDGNIYTIDPNGARRQAVTADASSSVVYQQPTWAPDTNSIAWTQVSSDGERLQPALVVSRPDGGILNNIELPFAPFYIYWSPDSQRLAYLSNWLSQSTPSMALRMVDLSGEEATTSTIAEGQPFYFSWAPDSQELLGHVGNEYVAVYSLDGNVEPLSDASTGFPTPQWTTAGDLIFAIDDQNGQGHLVMADRSAQELKELTTYFGSISFSLSATQDKLAYVVADEGAASATVGSLYMTDLETLSTSELSIQPVLAFFWSPDGEKLAYLQFEINNNQTGLRWKVWQDGKITEYDRFIPSQVFMRRYLAFFDQYAQSMSIWAPDSLAFVYAGSNSAGRRGIFVQSLDEEKPTRISSGVFAAWSPK